MARLGSLLRAERLYASTRNLRYTRTMANEKVQRSTTAPLTEEVRKGGVSVNPVVPGWLTGTMDQPAVTFDPGSTGTVQPEIIVDQTPPKSGTAPATTGEQ